jgi:hypothetical protein
MSKIVQVFSQAVIENCHFDAMKHYLQWKKTQQGNRRNKLTFYHFRRPRKLSNAEQLVEGS